MEYYITTLIAATFGTLGFGMLFKIKPSTLPICCVGGFLTWAIVLICQKFGAGVFSANLFAAVFAIVFSSFVAIKIKLPSTILLTTCVVPLVPGGSLYYTMQSLILKDFDKFYEYGFNTLFTGFGIAGGIIFGSILFMLIKRPLPRIRSLNKFGSFHERFIMSDKNSSNVQIHYMHLNKEPFEQIQSGNKIIELRLYDEKRKRLKLGDIIEFENMDNEKKIFTKVEGLNVYPTFKELYEDISLIDMGYTKDQLNNASYKDMEEYYSLEEQKRLSVIAIRISVINP